MTALPATGARVRQEDLKVGPLLAEGGEGRVFQLPRQPHLLFKSFRDERPRPYLDAMVGWPETLDPAAQARVRAASAWPTAIVTGTGDRAVGLLVPRAPRRFAVRHRDGHSRLASLSYLTADPGHRAAAYGLELPAPASASRVGLLYALARLLDAFETGPAPVGHGDLSTKNVLWSLQRRPEVFVIDCDNSEVFGPDGSPAGDPSRRRAMTPNWDDPAVARGSNPTLASDRYSLALIFLRVVGAANFPVQARQRSGGPVRVEFPVPPGPGSDTLVDPGAPVWELAARALSVADPAARPAPEEWLPELGRILRAMGGADWVEGAGDRAAGDGAAGDGHIASRSVPAGSPPGDQAADEAGKVTVVPVRAARPSGRPWARVSPTPRYTAGPAPAGSGGPGGLAWRPVTAGPGGTGAPGRPQPPGAGGGEVVSGVAVWPELKTQIARVARWWLARHRAAITALLRSGGRRRGLRSALFCVVLDLAIAVTVLVFGAMITAPVLGV